MNFSKLITPEDIVLGLLWLCEALQSVRSLILSVKTLPVRLIVCLCFASV